MPEDADAVHAVSLKLPNFWSKNPRGWFRTIESSFGLRNITTSLTKYHYVVSTLDEDTSSRITDLIDAPPAADPYTAIKERMLASFDTSEYERSQRLLEMPALGDDRPSQLMDKMLVLLDNHPPCFLFRGIFYQRMPDYIRAALVHSKIEDCRELAKAADVLWSAHQASAIAVVKRHPSSPANSSRSSSGPRFCWYHSKFGDKATKCNQPCSFPGNGKVGRQ